MIRWIETCGILLFIILVGKNYGHLFQQRPLLSAAAALVSWPLGYFLADLLTGLIHWICDSFGHVQTPVWGPMVIASFRRHHQHPLEITQISVAENLGSSSIAGAAALLFFPVTAADVSHFESLVMAHFWLWVVVFSVVANRFHRWAHLPAQHRPRWITFLQKKKIVIGPKEHLAHHAKPYRTHYCVLSGWANLLTNRIPWYRIEAILARVGIHSHFD